MMSYPSGNGTKKGVSPIIPYPFSLIFALILSNTFLLQPLRTVTNAIKSPTMSVLRRDSHLELARLLIQRLERLSADSTWAHRASGYRGALIKHVEILELKPLDPLVEQQMDGLVRSAFELLTAAARQIPDVGVDVLPDQISGDLANRMLH
jgi:hypothetical protein